ncbi:MAG: hypothetical protein V3S63_06110 [bacterium]|jgi:hypothetical protein
MYVRIEFKGEHFTQNLFRELKILTNKARIRIDEVVYEKDKELVVVPLDRLELETGRGIIRDHKYNSDGKRSRCELVIYHVTGCAIENRFEKPGDPAWATVLFGMKVEKGTVYIGSAEELSGSTCYSIEVSVKELEIELYDVEEESAAGLTFGP